MSLSERIPLEEPTATVVPPTDDVRPRMPEPLPVRLVTVEDARLIAAAGLERNLDEFYVTLLGFERTEPMTEITYRAENFRLLFEVVEPPVTRRDMRILRIEVVSLASAEKKLVEAEMKYAYQKGLNPGQESILLQDPAGNWIELSGMSMIR